METKDNNLKQESEENAIASLEHKTEIAATERDGVKEVRDCPSTTEAKKKKSPWPFLGSVAKN